MIINFEKLTVFTDIKKTQSLVADVKNDIADVLYQNGNGVAALALALKIYNSHDGCEINEQEYQVLMDCICRVGTPMIIEALKETKK